MGGNNCKIYCKTLASDIYSPHICIVNHAKIKKMNTDNLISLSEFAELAGLQPYEVTRLITPQEIIPVKIGKHKLIDKVKYPPENYKKK